uniref:Alpha-carbonic anhydrase domain-containing protein n=1 Tax=Terrapene triunguis TaxID=2587831 RepID=A0A674I656_9SAUR
QIIVTDAATGNSLGAKPKRGTKELHAHWSDDYPDCGGQAQSPIDIQTKSVQHDPALPPIEPQGYQSPGDGAFTLFNNGHTVKMSLPPSMFLRGLPQTYAAVQLHFHWGSRGQAGGSEHQVNGEAFPAEVSVLLPQGWGARGQFSQCPIILSLLSQTSRAIGAKATPGAAPLKSMGLPGPTLPPGSDGARIHSLMAVRGKGAPRDCAFKNLPPLSLQLHIVHYNSESYANISEAKQRADSLAVLGILIEVSSLPVTHRGGAALVGPTMQPACGEGGKACAGKSQAFSGPDPWRLQTITNFPSPGSKC